MKLKKIASLMLAGIMAVSMLAACGEGKGNSSSSSSSSEVTNVSNAAAGINAELDDAKGVISFTGNEELANAVKNYYKNNPFKADEWATKGNGLMYSCTAVVGDMLNVDVVANDERFNDVIDLLEGTDENSKQTGLVVYGFNQKYFTADNVLKFIGQAVDDIEYADDYVASPAVEDNKRYSYSGNAEMVEIKSANGEVSVWVVAVMFTKDYVNR